MYGVTSRQQVSALGPMKYTRLPAHGVDEGGWRLGSRLPTAFRVPSLVSYLMCPPTLQPYELIPLTFLPSHWCFLTKVFAVMMSSLR